MKTYNTTGIVLTIQDHGENDRRFSIFTKDFGKIETVAKGTRKILSKLNPHLQPLSHVSLMVAQGKRIDKLANAVSLMGHTPAFAESFGEAKENTENLETRVLLDYVREVTDQLTEVHLREADIYHNLNSFLSYIKSNQDLNYHFLSNSYILKLLDLLGYRPELKRCIECSCPIIFPKAVLDVNRGGIICDRCQVGAITQTHYEITDSIIKILNTVLDSNYETLGNYRFNLDDLNDFNQVVYKLASYQVSKPIQSVEFLKKVSIA